MKILALSTLALCATITGCQSAPTEAELAKLQEDKVIKVLDKSKPLSDSDSKNLLLLEFHTSQKIIYKQKALSDKIRKQKLEDLSYSLADYRYSLNIHNYTETAFIGAQQVYGSNTLVDPDRYSYPKEIRLKAEFREYGEIIARGKENLAYTHYYQSSELMKAGMPPIDPNGERLKVCQLTPFSDTYYELSAVMAKTIKSDAPVKCLTGDKSKSYWTVRYKTLLSSNNELL